MRSPYEDVLDLLRLFKSSVRQDAGIAIESVISSKFKLQIGSSLYYAALAAIVRQVSEVEALIIDEIRLGDEGREGLLAALSLLKTSVRPENLRMSVNNAFNSNIEMMVSQFSIAVGYFNGGEPFRGWSDDLKSVADELVDLRESLNAVEMDEAARRVILQNLGAFELFIRNIEIFGFDAAYSSYIDLVLRVRKDAFQAPDSATRKEARAIWPKIRQWGKRLAEADEAWDHGVKLIGHLTEAVDAIGDA